MSTHYSELNFNTKGEVEIIDITSKVNKIVKDSKIKNGQVLVFCPGSTGALTTIEYEPGLLDDFPKALERLFPKNMTYQHHLRWHDGNGHSHVRASFLGPSLTIPIINGNVTLGTWQQIVFIELDNKSRHRRLIVQITGDS